MSSFSGFIDDFPGLSIDSFVPRNLTSKAFFLTHKHEDHMVGMMSTRFAYHLRSNSETSLYCSKITAALLQNDESFAHLSDYLVGLTENEAHRIEIPDRSDSRKSIFITVTLISANHCPGSVMFLFENTEKTVLYTGDFRLEDTPLSSIAELHAKNSNSIRHIDKLYCDTTFCIPDQAINHFPPRNTSIQCIEELTRTWITQGSNYVVVILQSAALGFEPIFIHLHRVFNIKVHMSSKQHSQYRSIRGMCDFSTTDSETQIHACTMRWQRQLDPEYNGLLPCDHDRGMKRDLNTNLQLQVRVIKVSTMWFTNQCTKTTDYCVPIREPYSYRVCYSFHSSYDEIKHFISYLKPDNAFPTVVPKHCTLAQVREVIQKILNVAKNMNTCTDVDSSKKPDQLGKLRKNNRSPLLQTFDSDSEFDFGDL